MTRQMRAAIVTALVLVAVGPVSARDWYVSADTGKGKTGTREQPAKDLGNILSKLEAGDRVFIAAGVYLGRGDNGSDVITVPVEIYGGWDSSFSQRDPWGAHQTILSGDNMSKNWDGEHRLAIDLSKWRKNEKHRIVIDGIIVDNGGRNRYADDSGAKIIRMANPKTGQNPTPRTAGVRVMAGKQGDVVVRNCIVMNTAPSEGAYSIWGNEASEILVENNLAINNTGSGFALHTSWHPRESDELPAFTFRNNTSLFSEKPDAAASEGGNGVKLESDTRVAITESVIAFNDMFGIDNARRSKGIVLNNNLIYNNIQGDYLEFDTRMTLESLEDEAEHLDEAEDNVATEIKVPVAAAWAAFYASRNIIDRNAAEADVKVQETKVNALRSMLGLNVQGTDLDVDTDAWLPRMSVADAIRAGSSRYDGKYGCQKPAPSAGLE